MKKEQTDTEKKEVIIKLSHYNYNNLSQTAMVLSDKLCIALTKIYFFFFLLSPETPHTFNRINSFSYLLCDYYRTHGFVLFNRLIFNTLNYKFSLATEFKKKKVSNDQHFHIMITTVILSPLLRCLTFTRLKSI